MDKNAIIIELVRLGFDYKFEYENDVYSNETRKIFFVKNGFRSDSIFMKDLSESHLLDIKSKI